MHSVILNSWRWLLRFSDLFVNLEKDSIKRPNGTVDVTLWVFSACAGNQISLGGATMGVATSDQTNLHTDSMPNSLNTNKSVQY